MSVAWVVLGVTDLYPYLSKDQQELVSDVEANAALVLDILHQVSLRVRSEIQANPANQLGSTQYSIPPELKYFTLFLAMEIMPLAIRGLQLDEDQRKVIAEAKEYLKRIAERKVAVSVPSNAGSAEVPQIGQAEVVTSSTREATRDTLAGL